MLQIVDKHRVKRNVPYRGNTSKLLCATFAGSEQKLKLLCAMADIGSTHIETVVRNITNS